MGRSILNSKTVRTITGDGVKGDILPPMRNIHGLAANDIHRGTPMETLDSGAELGLLSTAEFMHYRRTRISRSFATLLEHDLLCALGHCFLVLYSQFITRQHHSFGQVLGPRRGRRPNRAGNIPFKSEKSYAAFAAASAAAIPTALAAATVAVINYLDRLVAVVSARFATRPDGDVPSASLSRPLNNGVAETANASHARSIHKALMTVQVRWPVKKPALCSE
ncbi:uncharacterized protein BO97DRAFT_428880 [Aspergillus homomorphus CBS 101889]|uniref:Uncharacterized protein n=1 Tax=Aspergillus homomorphus (strain CBS 101889) TaxID=1450537 RepID=A0A395HJ32_ASPHC|nr:hypothetical protein BO97DRAFT_428880 [Aspergillus homomorphus CBS 101889]RAL07837.1 hypothetical protein BO97DRAFT_428880 [Aspergillus homomorphus CBS 101889]